MKLHTFFVHLSPQPLKGRRVLALDTVELLKLKEALEAVCRHDNDSYDGCCSQCGMKEAAQP